MIEKTFYCPTEKEKRIFKRVDNGIPVVGKYQCNGCGKEYGEYNLHPEGFEGAIRDNLKELIIENGR